MVGTNAIVLFVGLFVAMAAANIKAIPFEVLNSTTTVSPQNVTTEESTTTEDPATIIPEITTTEESSTTEDPATIIPETTTTEESTTTEDTTTPEQETTTTQEPGPEDICEGHEWTPENQLTGDYLRPHEDCSKFWSCTAAGDAVEMDCPAGLLWHDAEKICDWPYNSDCGQIPA